MVRDLLIADINTVGSGALEILKGLPDNAKEIKIILMSDVMLFD